MKMTCPNCGSDKTRRGGSALWAIYVSLIAMALIGVLVFHLNAALIAGIMIAIIILAHLTIGQRICLACGHQWRGR